MEKQLLELQRKFAEAEERAAEEQPKSEHAEARVVEEQRRLEEERRREAAEADAEQSQPKNLIEYLEAWRGCSVSRLQLSGGLDDRAIWWRLLSSWVEMITEARRRPQCNLVEFGAFVGQ
jgi:hypothetical protein